MSKVPCDKCGFLFHPKELREGFGCNQLCGECYEIMAGVEEIPFNDWEDEDDWGDSDE